MSINACGTKVLMLFSLLLANIRLPSCFFFLFFVILSNFFAATTSVVKEKIKVKLDIPTGSQ